MIERKLLGSVLINPESFKTLNKDLRSSMFNDRRNRFIFNVIKYLVKKEQPFDVVNLINILINIGDIDKAGGEQYILELTNEIETSEEAELLSDLIVEGNLDKGE